MAVQCAFEARFEASSTSETKSVTVLSVDTYPNIILPAHNNVRAEVNQIFRL